jgi:hypothetical protein
MRNPPTLLNTLLKRLDNSIEIGLIEKRHGDSVRLVLVDDAVERRFVLVVCPDLYITYQCTESKWIWMFFGTYVHHVSDINHEAAGDRIRADPIALDSPESMEYEIMSCWIYLL